MKKTDKKESKEIDLLQNILVLLFDAKRALGIGPHTTREKRLLIAHVRHDLGKVNDSNIPKKKLEKARTINDIALLLVHTT